MTKQEQKAQIVALFNDALLASEATAQDAERFVSFVDVDPAAFKSFCDEDVAFYIKASFFKVLLLQGSDRNRAAMAKQGVIYQANKGLGGN